MWRKYKPDGSEIVDKIKTFFGVLDSEEDMASMRENFENRTQRSVYGISLQKSLPEFLHSESFKKKIAIDQLKEAFSQMSVDELNDREIQELIDSSTCIIRSSQNLPYSSSINQPAPSSHSVNLPVPSDRTEKVYRTIAIPPSDTLKTKQSPQLSEEMFDSVEIDKMETDCSPFECGTLIKKLSKSSTTAKSFERLANVTSSSKTSNVEPMSLLNRRSFQSLLKEKYSKRSLQSSNIQLQETVPKNVHLFSLEEFVKSTNILKEEDLKHIEVNNASVTRLPSVPSLSYCTNEAVKYIGLTSNEMWPDQKLTPIPDCTCNEEIPNSAHGEMTSSPTSYSTEPSDEPSTSTDTHGSDEKNTRAMMEELSSFCSQRTAQLDRSAAQIDRSAAQPSNSTVQPKNHAVQSDSPAVQPKSHEVQSKSPAFQSSRPKKDLERPSVQSGRPTAQSFRSAAESSRPTTQPKRPGSTAQRSAHSPLHNTGRGHSKKPTSPHGQSNINNSAVHCKPNKIHPVDCVDSDVHGVDSDVHGAEMNLNNNSAVGGGTDDNQSATSSDGGSTEAQDKTNTDPSSGPKTSPDTQAVEKADLLNVELVDNHSELTGLAALKHYQLFSAIERAVQIKNLELIKQQVISDYLWKIDVVEEIYETAKAYYSNPEGDARNRWKELRREVSKYSKDSMTDIRIKLTSFGNFHPLFTYFIIMTLVMSVSIICALFGITRIGLEPKLTFHENIKTFLGKETIHKWTIPNVWIGPDMKGLIAAGGVFGLCMRDNHHTSLLFIDLYNMSKSQVLGCCEVASRNTAGTTSKKECSHMTGGVGVWRKGVMCRDRPPGKNSVAHVLKPCCISIQGICIHTSHSHCVFVGGTYHMNKDHCSHVTCATDICKLGGFEPDPDMPWLPKKPNQWGRFLLSLLYSHGIIHTLLLLLGCWLLMRETEQTIGWMRMLFVYITSGLNGCLIASVFSPLSPQVGTSGAVMGTVGVLAVELSQAWKLIQKPWLETAKIVGLLFATTFLGMFPLVSNYSILVGFMTGMICAVAFLPYITFGWWTPRARLMICLSGLALLLLSHFIFFYLFYYVQDLTQCVSCTAFDCIPFTEKICDFSLLDYDNDG